MNAPPSACAAAGDAAFDPQIGVCLRTFDFTLRFESIFLSIFPSSLFVLAALTRTFFLTKVPRRLATGNAFQILKMGAYVIFGLLQLCSLVLWLLYPTESLTVAIIDRTLLLVTAFILGLLSYAEHGRNIRPSSLLGGYLSISLLFDAVCVRTLWLARKDLIDASLSTTSIILKLCILVLEMKSKRGYLYPEDRLRGREEVSNIFSQAIFYWLNPLIMTGYKKVLSLEDLYPLDRKLSAQCLHNKVSSSTISGTGKNRLLLGLAAAFKWELVIPILPRLFLLAFTLVQPLLLHSFIDYLQQPEQSESVNKGYILILAYGLTYFGLAISAGFYYHSLYRFTTMVRGALVSAIYEKTTEISITALDNSAAVTLMGADVDRILNGLRMVHEFWANLVQVGVASWLLQQELGIAFIAPIFLVIAVIVGIFVLSKMARAKQAIWMTKLQKRIGVISAMLSSIKGVKMTSLMEKIGNIVQNLRITEVVSAKKFRMVQVYTSSLAFVPLQISPVITFTAFAAITHASGVSLDTTRMFTSLSLLSLLNQPLSQTFQNIPIFVAALGCLLRVEEFLSKATNLDRRFVMELDIQPPSVEPEIGPHGFELQSMRQSVNISNHQHRDREVITIRNGTFSWSTSEEPILQDIDITVTSSQLVMVVGPIASGKSTLLKSILGETPSSQGFVYISSTRIAFCDQIPWLKNGTVKSNIVSFCDFDSLWYKAVIQACGLEEDLAIFPMGDQSHVGSKGIALSGGQKQRIAIARAVYSRKRIILLDDVFSGMDSMTEQIVFERLFGLEGLLRQNGITTILATHAVNLLPSADHVIALGTSGEIVEQGTFQELNNSQGYVQSLYIQNSKRPGATATPAIDTALGPTLVPHPRQLMHDKKRQLGDFSVYLYYFRLIGRTSTLLFFFLNIFHSFFYAFPSVWLNWWAEANGEHPNQKIGYFLSVYAAMQIVGLITMAALIWHSLTIMNVKAGLKLHRTALTTVLSAPMSLFSLVDAGVLLNRFSQDIQLIDDELPKALMNLSASFFTCIAQAVLIASATFYIALAYPLVIAVLYCIQKIYLRTSRQLRFMDLEAKSPLYTQFIESLSGLATIRAFGWQHEERTLNLQLLDNSQKPFYLLSMVQRWLTLVLDLVAMFLALIITGLAVKLRHIVSPGFTGIALLNLIQFNSTLQSLITWWIMLETSIAAVSRIKTFSEETESEFSPLVFSAPENWPMEGSIQFENVSASYNSIENKALDSISLSIRPGEKLGICGRSGSGKTSFTIALFRMLELTSGAILIDNLDISTLSRESIRSNINGIPQEPYFLHGTIRLNLDPYGASTDLQITAALQKVHLRDLVVSQGGLDVEMDVDSFSHGQKQLFCLARAILRPCKIVVLDEFTSSVDRDTDALMQRLIREEFKNHTIISVAHRVETILDFDRIAVLDSGKVIEYDKPSNLLSRPSVFRELYGSRS